MVLHGCCKLVERFNQQEYNWEIIPLTTSNQGPISRAIHVLQRWAQTFNPHPSSYNIL